MTKQVRKDVIEKLNRGLNHEQEVARIFNASIPMSWSYDTPHATHCVRQMDGKRFYNTREFDGTPAHSEEVTA